MCPPDGSDSSTGDAFGEMVTDYAHGRLTAQPVYRRADGTVTNAHLEWYLSDPASCDPHERTLLDAAVGRSLDVDCGVGRASSYLTRRGHDVEYDGTVGPWVSLLFVAPPVLRSVLRPTPWTLLRRVDGPAGEYGIVFERR